MSYLHASDNVISGNVPKVKTRNTELQDGMMYTDMSNTGFSRILVSAPPESSTYWYSHSNFEIFGHFQVVTVVF